MSLNVSSDSAPVIEKKDEASKSGSGKSEPIPSVQEIVKNNPCDVPEEYIRTHPLDGPEPILHHLTPQIPIIDFSKVKEGNEEELSKLDMACTEWGFFQLVNHGIEDLIQRVKGATAQFFEQPLEEKQKFAMLKENSEGYGHIEVLHPAEDLEKRDWSDALLLLTHPVQNRDIKYWPTYPKEYPNLVDRFSGEIYQVGVELLNAISLNLGLSRAALHQLHQEPRVYFFANYYPPCSKPDQVLGMDRHSDENTMSMLFQDQNDATALQIKHKEGYVPVTPISNAIVVNIGDLIEAWSNGKYTSVEHRAMTISTKVRSIHQAIFLPAPDVVVQPVEPDANQLLRAQRKLYKEIRVGDYSYLYTHNKKHDGRSQINSMMI